MFFKIYRCAPIQTGIMRRQAGLPLEPTQLRTSFIASSRCLSICFHLHALLYTALDTCYCHTALRAPRPFLSMHTHRTHPHTHNSTSTQTRVILSCAFNNTPKWFSAVRRNPSSSRPESYILLKAPRLSNGALYTGAQWAQGEEGTSSGSCCVVLCDPFQTFPWVLRSSGGILVLY